MDYFGFELQQATSSPCCDVCSKPPQDATPQERPLPKKPGKEAKRISLSLQYYFRVENSKVHRNCRPELSTGLCAELADAIACEPEKYVAEGKLEEDFRFLHPTYIEGIQDIVKSILSMS